LEHQTETPISKTTDLNIFYKTLEHFIFANCFKEKISVPENIVKHIIERYIKINNFLLLSELLSHLGIPKPLAVALINIILEVYYSDTDKEAKILFENNIAFKNCKASDIPHIINTMELEKIFVSTAILVIIVSIGFNISSSILLVSIVSELYLVLKCEYRERHLKGFLK
jgi:hypothetical protein